MAPTPRKQLKGDVEKNFKIEPICTLSPAEIKQVLDARAKSPRTSIPALASILKIDGEQVKLALKMVRKKSFLFMIMMTRKANRQRRQLYLRRQRQRRIRPVSIHLMNFFNSILHLSAPQKPVPAATILTKILEMVSITIPMTTVTWNRILLLSIVSFSIYSKKILHYSSIVLNRDSSSYSATDHRTQREKIIEYFSNYDNQLEAANARIRNLQKVSKILKSKKTELATENNNLKEDLKRNNDRLVALTKNNDELKQALDVKEKSFGMEQLANKTDVTCIGCNKKMLFNFRELAFCSTECVRSVALKLKGAESLKAMLAPPRPTEN